MLVKYLRVLGATLAFIMALAATAIQVNILPAPPNCLAPDVAVDAKGVVHQVYGLGNDAFYRQSADGGRTFTAPMKLNTELQVTTTMGERGPKIALGRGGSIHVIWADKWSPGVKTFARYARSLDGGRTFEAPRMVNPTPAPDGLTLAADDAGNVAVCWHSADPQRPHAEKAATWLYLVRSTDNGATFGVPEPLKANNLAGLACSMCMMRARMDAKNLYLAFRNAEGNVRDFVVLKSAKGANDFTGVRVNTDNWVLDSCPMCGPELTLDPQGRALCAFMSKNKVYWAVADAGVTKFDLHVATPANETNEIYPCALADAAGNVLFVWQLGPMSVNSTAVVKWAVYTRDGKLTDQQGAIGTSFSGTKATAFLGADGSFNIVTTAR